LATTTERRTDGLSELRRRAHSQVDDEVAPEIIGEVDDAAVAILLQTVDLEPRELAAGGPPVPAADGTRLNAALESVSVRDRAESAETGRWRRAE
jgi:hypothetical protein